MSELVATSFTSSTFRLITFRKRQQLSAAECLLRVSSVTNYPQSCCPLVEIFNTKMYLKHENVFQIHKIHANCISITKYKLLVKLTKYKMHNEMYFNYLYFNLLHYTGVSWANYTSSGCKLPTVYRHYENWLRVDSYCNENRVQLFGSPCTCTAFTVIIRRRSQTGYWGMGP